MSLQEVNDGPKLSAEGERVLRNALEHRAAQTRWDHDVLHVAAEPPHEPPTSGREHTRSTLVAVSAGVAVVLVGLVVAIGAFATSSSGGSAVAETVTGDTGLDPIDPAVMGRTEVAADEVATASDEPASIVDAPAGIVPDVDESAVSSSALESLGAMELQAYATGQASVTSFAVRVRQIGGASIETANLSMTVTTEAGSIPATLEFEQHDLPPGSSAVAIVRLANPLTERADLHLVYDGTTVAEAELASTAG